MVAALAFTAAPQVNAEPAAMPANTPVSGVVGAESRASADEFWTPERMAEAIRNDETRQPVSAEEIRQQQVDDSLVSTTDRAQPVSAPPAKPTKAPAGMSRTAAEWSGTDTMGKFFYYNPWEGKPKSCTGTVVNNGNFSTVMLAAHCIHGGEGKDWMQQMLFIPAYSIGNEPYGRWEIHAYAAWTGWTENSEYRWDYGFVAVNNSVSATPIQEWTGGQGWATSQPRTRWVQVFGYPLNVGGGETLYGFADWTAQVTANMDKIPDHDWEGGSSGGPWFINFDYTNYLGYATGVISLGSSDGNLWTPVFDENFPVLVDLINQY